MTAQNKTFPADVGSDVLREVVNQLNSALATATVPVQAQMGSLTDGSTSFNISGAAASIGCIIFVANEDMYIEDIDLLLTAASDADTGVVVDILLAAEDTAAAPDPGTNALVFASDGTGPMFAAGTRESLAAQTATDAGTGLDANSFTATTGAHAAVATKDFASFRLDQGQKLRLLLTEVGAAAEGATAYIHYRPVQDRITLAGGGVASPKTFRAINR